MLFTARNLIYTFLKINSIKYKCLFYMPSPKLFLGVNILKVLTKALLYS